MKIKINNTEYHVLDGIRGIHLLSILHFIAGEQFGEYWLNKINPNGVDTSLKNDDLIVDGDSFWAIPPCYK